MIIMSGQNNDHIKPNIALINVITKVGSSSYNIGHTIIFNTSCLSRQSRNSIAFKWE